MTPISDHNAFFGRYISKKEKAVPLFVARELERESDKHATRAGIALGEIERAHKELDKIGVPRNRKNTPFPLSLAGRIRLLGGVGSWVAYSHILRRNGVKWGKCESPGKGIFIGTRKLKHFTAALVCPSPHPIYVPIEAVMPVDEVFDEEGGRENGLY